MSAVPRKCTFLQTKCRTSTIHHHSSHTAETDIGRPRFNRMPSLDQLSHRLWAFFKVISLVFGIFVHILFRKLPHLNDKQSKTISSMEFSLNSFEFLKGGVNPGRGEPHFSARNREGNAKNFKARGVTGSGDSDSGQSFLVIGNCSNPQNGK